MSKPFDIVGEIFKEHFKEDPMRPLKNLYAEAQLQKAEQAKKSRSNRKAFIESELVEFRPDYIDAKEILSALKTGLALRTSPHGDDLPLEVEHAFNDLEMSFDACEAALYEPEAYDSIGEERYNGDNLE